jgi:hypothetical protein
LEIRNSLPCALPRSELPQPVTLFCRDSICCCYECAVDCVPSERCCEDQTDDETEGVWLPFPAGLAPLPHLITNEAFV